MNNNLKIVALALHFSIVMYGVILFVLMQGDPTGWEMGFKILPEWKLLVIVLAAFSLINSAVAIFVKAPIPRMAVAESIAIFGFLAAFLNHSFLLLVPFAIWSLLLQIYVGPWVQKD